MITGKWGMRDRLGVEDSHVPTAIFKIDNSREQHRNMYTIKGETDHQPRLDA